MATVFSSFFKQKKQNEFERHSLAKRSSNVSPHSFTIFASFIVSGNKTATKLWTNSAANVKSLENIWNFIKLIKALTLIQQIGRQVTVFCVAVVVVVVVKRFRCIYLRMNSLSHNLKQTRISMSVVVLMPNVIWMQNENETEKSKKKKKNTSEFTAKPAFYSMNNDASANRFILPRINQLNVCNLIFIP